MRDDVDSRLCPRQVNVAIDVAAVAGLAGLGEFVNRLTTHVDYENDERVMV